MRGTVRDKTNAGKIEELKAAFGEHFTNLELVDVDLLNADSVNAAVAGSTYVVHTASPVLNDGDKAVETAVDGTLNVLKACRTGGVKRCVVTGSVDAVVYTKEADKPPIGTAWTEASCSDLEAAKKAGSYQQSKTHAEQKAWEY